MNQEEKKMLQQVRFRVEEILTLLNPEIRMDSDSLKELTHQNLLEMLDCLRVYIKYNMLDLEATQRERNYLH
ncbi:MAG: hypothetical protein ACTSPI_17565 [Candidatus Heimdallarchaeaceae archaeon]